MSSYNAHTQEKPANLLDVSITVPVSAFRAFTVMIDTKNGTSRFCVDYCISNRVVDADRWPLVVVEEAFTNFKGFTISTTFDLFSGCQQVEVADAFEETIPLTIRCGAYKFEVMIPGLVNAPSTFQRMINIVTQSRPL